jgi:hypothetical protein
MVNPLAKPTLDNVPYVVSIFHNNSKGEIIFLSKSLDWNAEFSGCCQTIWEINCPRDEAKKKSAKFKLVRKKLKQWSTSISMLNGIIFNWNNVILMLVTYEEMRPLHITEWNFQNIVKKKLQHVLLCKLDWEVRTHRFHPMATI